MKGRNIREDWIRDLNVIEYREHVFAAMAAAQNRYLERRKIRKIPKQREALRTLKEAADFKSVNPPVPNFSFEKRRMVKEGRNMFKRSVERYFIVDSHYLTYFGKDKDSNYKKSVLLTEAGAALEFREEV